MKLTVKRQAFEKILNTVYEAIPNQTPESSYRNFLVTIDETGVWILGSDGTISIQGHIANDDEALISYENGAVQIPAKYLLDIVKNLQADIVTVELVDESLLHISDELSEFRLKVIDAKEYPDVEMKSDSEEKVTIKTKDFIKLYDSTYFAVASKGPKEFFCGVNIVAKENKLLFVATDSFRLARKYIDIDTNDTFSIIVPIKTLNTVSHLSEYDSVTLSIETSRVLFTLGDFVIASKLYSGEFPNVDRIIPTGINYTLEVNSREFISAIERITIVGNTRILVSCSPDKVKVSSKDMNIGTSLTTLTQSHYIGNESFSIIFNSAYVLDAVKALDAEKVKLEFVSDSRAFLVSSDDVSVTQVVTPIRSLAE